MWSIGTSQSISRPVYISSVFGVRDVGTPLPAEFNAPARDRMEHGSVSRLRGHADDFQRLKHQGIEQRLKIMT